MTTDQTPVTLTKRRVVLDLVPTRPSPGDDSSALYARPDEDREAPAITLPLIYLTPADFRALGEREQITITIEPGNTLTEIDRNAEAEPEQCPITIAMQGYDPVRCERDVLHGGPHWSNAELVASAPKKAAR